MAEKRMFAKSVVDSDNFLDMPLTTQALYFHLGMRADDDGFVDCPRKIQRAIGCSDDDLKLLIAKGFAIAFNSGLIVIRHWKLHNYIPKDRYKETVYLKEKAQLTTDENRAYGFVFLDDFGAERETSFMEEVVYFTVDTLYRFGIPFVLTTNMTAEDIKRSDNIALGRVLSRLYEACYFHEFKGPDRRREILKADKQTL